MQQPKRLIEVDLPIRKISEHAQREKNLKSGHLSTLHIWWARRPLAACRAVICASIWPDPVDDSCPPRFRSEAAAIFCKFASKVARDKNLAERCSESTWNLCMNLAKNNYSMDLESPNGLHQLRTALLAFISDFANWDNSSTDAYLEVSRELTRVAHESIGGMSGTLPLVVDPFAGGGSIPLETLRVGADAFASDLNPIPVLLNKIVLEYIPRYGTHLIDEIIKWSKWLKDRAEQKLSQFYPEDDNGVVPIAYLWARTIHCEGPGCGTELPLIGLPWLSKKEKNRVALGVLPNEKEKHIDFKLFSPKADSDLPPPISRRLSATCPLCGFTTPYKNVREQIRSKEGGTKDPRLLAVILRKTSGDRVFRLPKQSDFLAVRKASETLTGFQKHFTTNSELSIPNEEFPTWYSGVFNPGLWNITTWGRLFTDRQLLSLLTFCSIVREAKQRMLERGLDAHLVEAIVTCLSLPVSNLSHYLSSVSIWAQDHMISAFIQGSGIAMRPDFAEANPLSPELVGGISYSFEKLISGLKNLSTIPYTGLNGVAEQSSATHQKLPDDSANYLITDPPYYAAIPYSDLSDFCYVWLKRMLFDLHPSLFSTTLTPKDEEAVAYYTQPDGITRAKKDGKFFEDKMQQALAECRRILIPEGIGIIVFAHKGTAGWEAMLGALLKAGWIVTASWPIDTERAARMRAKDSATLASSVHLVCRPRENPDGSVRVDDIGDWRDVLAELPRRIHDWMPRLADEGVVGADAIFACIGPALEIFSRYSRVEKASGETVTLKEYLEQIWAAVSREALSMIFEGAEGSGLEEDARLTAMWLWTLSTGGEGLNENGDDELLNDEEVEKAGKAKSTGGFTLEFDAARKIAQGLGVHMDQLKALVEIKGDVARLLPVSERAGYLFGQESSRPQVRRKKGQSQLDLFQLQELSESEEAWEVPAVSKVGETVLDRIHQSMLLFAGGRSESLKRFLVEEGAGRDSRFWKLAQALSALYPSGSDEKRWVDGVLARKKGLGF